MEKKINKLFFMVVEEQCPILLLLLCPWDTIHVIGETINIPISNDNYILV